MKEAEQNNQFFYHPVQLKKTTDDEDDSENFSDANEPPKQVSMPQVKQTPVVQPPTTNKVFLISKCKYFILYIKIILANCRITIGSK